MSLPNRSKWKVSIVKLMTLSLVSLILVIPTSHVASENILLFLGMTTYSHRMSIWPLILKLADKGHNITVLSSHPPRFLADPRIHELVPPTLVEFNSKYLSSDLLKLRLKSFYDSQAVWDEFPQFTITMYEMLVKDVHFLKWFESATFDLVLLDALYCDFALGLAYKFNALTAIISTSSPYMWQLDSMGASVESWIPDLQFAFPDDMNFGQRIVNVFKPIYWNILREWSYFPKLEKILREDLKLRNMPPLQVLEKNVSLVFTNSHYSQEYPRSSPPNLISIGGLHCSHYKQNDNDLNQLGKFMNESGTTGFIYLSFGSAAAVSKMPVNLQKIFFDTMRNIPTNFVLKWEGEPPKNLTKNVFPSMWLPQQNVLSHPNIRGFISHGGLLGIQEGICAGVPLIVLPMFAEQDFNANRIEGKKCGIKLNWNTLSQDILTEAIFKILKDPTYKQNMKKMSNLFMDRPQTPLETATYWVDYLLRNGHVEALQPLGIRQTWYERRLLDVWLYISLILTILTIIVITCGIFLHKIFVIQMSDNEKKMN